MVHLLYLYDVNDRHGHVYVDGDVDVVHFVKAERSNLLVVVVLYIQIRGGKQYKNIKSAFMKISLQLSSSLWSKQLDVWSHLIKRLPSPTEKLTLLGNETTGDMNDMDAMCC